MNLLAPALELDESATSFQCWGRQKWWSESLNVSWLVNCLILNLLRPTTCILVSWFEKSSTSENIFWPIESYNNWKPIMFCKVGKGRIDCVMLGISKVVNKLLMFLFSCWFKSVSKNYIYIFSNSLLLAYPNLIFRKLLQKL